MIRGQAAAARGFETVGREAAGASDAGDILRRIASVVGEIDALKRERHATPVLDARAKLAEIYFRKRPISRLSSPEGERFCHQP
ncbi:MAG TPA: hypothetical protein VF744_10530 [Beijerinckiaceae bacterium]|jgi:hypothetical protein